MNIMIVEDDIALNHGIALAFSNSGDTFFPVLQSGRQRSGSGQGSLL